MKSDRLRDEAEAEETLQEAFFQIWEEIDTYNENLGNFLSWIIRIARNKAIDRLREQNF